MATVHTRTRTGDVAEMRTPASWNAMPPDIVTNRANRRSMPTSASAARVQSGRSPGARRMSAGYALGSGASNTAALLGPDDDPLPLPCLPSTSRTTISPSFNLRSARDRQPAAAWLTLAAFIAAERSSASPSAAAARRLAGRQSPRRRACRSMQAAWLRRVDRSLPSQIVTVAGAHAIARSVLRCARPRRSRHWVRHRTSHQSDGTVPSDRRPCADWRHPESWTTTP